jgi:predicted NBD/HSP70 family sugar kinase
MRRPGRLQPSNCSPVVFLTTILNWLRTQEARMNERPVDFFAPAGRGLQHASLRSANRRAVLTSIGTNPGSSIADLARLTGLAPQTASAIVGRLESDGLVVRGDVLRGRRGQPATPLYLHRDGAFSIGLEVGWRHVELILLNLRLEVIARHRRDYAYPDARTIVAECAAMVRQVLDELPVELRGRIVGIGLTSPSEIGSAVATLDAPGDQQGLWEALDLLHALQAATTLPILWFNDGNAGCWAELVAMKQPRPADLTYLHVGTFLSAGIVAEHRLWEGRNGNSANLGAMLVYDRDAYGPAHLAASLFALGQKLAAAGIAVPDGDPLAWPWGRLEPVVSRWLDGAADALAQVIANTMAVFEFELAIIDGTMPRDLLGRLATATRQRLDGLPVMTSGALIVEGRFGREAASRGAAALTIYRRYFSRAPEPMVG